jgi:hypothetical protein
MSRFPVMVRSISPSGEVRFSLGDPLVDSYLEFVAGRCRPNTLRAVTLDLKVFFTVVAKDPVTVEPPDLFEFLVHQRGDRTVVRVSDRRFDLVSPIVQRTEHGEVRGGVTGVDVQLTDQVAVAVEHAVDRGSLSHRVEVQPVLRLGRAHVGELGTGRLNVVEVLGPELQVRGLRRRQRVGGAMDADLGAPVRSVARRARTSVPPPILR